jgi:phosphatidylserine/phosphatidylglycerophosphate/cardiolipin synthase-like enzyme
LIDKGQANDVNADDKKLEEAGVQLRRSKWNGSMHNKFTTIDGKIVYTGIYNHTQSATTRNDENYIIIKDQQTAETYE